MSTRYIILSNARERGASGHRILYRRMTGLGLINCTKPFHTAIYTLAVYPLGLTYCLALSLLFLRFRDARIWRLLAYPGKMGKPRP